MGQIFSLSLSMFLICMLRNVYYTKTNYKNVLLWVRSKRDCHFMAAATTTTMLTKNVNNLVDFMKKKKNLRQKRVVRRMEYITSPSDKIVAKRSFCVRVHFHSLISTHFIIRTVINFGRSKWVIWLSQNFPNENGKRILFSFAHSMKWR